MPAKLPFVTEPKPVETVRVGNAEVGELEIKKLNDLSPNERSWIRQQQNGQPDVRKEIIRLAQQIASKSGEALIPVYSTLANLLTYGVGGDELQTDEDDLQQIIDLQDNLALTSEQKTTIYATAIVRFRLVPEWSIEDSGNADLMHPNLLGEIAAFAFKEEAHWPEAKTEESEEEPLTENDLGKSLSPMTEAQTGQTSIGDSSDIGPMTPDSTQTTSDSSQPG